MRYRPSTVLAFVCIGQFMVFTDVSIVNLALPTIQRDLGMSDVSLGYVVTAYATVLGGCLLLGGRLADLLGRRRLIRIGFTLFAAASLASGLASTGGVLVAARAVQGFGSALITPAALSILANTFAEGEARNKALGVWGSLTGLASIVGVIAGGLLADGPGWEWIFWINVPIGAGAALLAPRFIPESRRAERAQAFDVPGAALLTGGLLLLIFTLGETTHVGWGALRTVGSLAGVVALIGAFVAVELRAADPVVPLRVFRLRTMRTANVSSLLVFGTVSAMFFFVSLFMQQVFGYSPLKAGFAYVPMAVAVAMGAWLGSELVTRTAARTVVIAGLVLSVAGLLWLRRAPADGGYLLDLLPGFLAAGVGCGLCFVSIQIAAFVGVDEHDAGVGAGLINTSQEAGGALGLAVVTAIAYGGLGEALAAAGGNGAAIRAAHAAADHDAFLAAACMGLAALVLVAVLMPRPRSLREQARVAPA